MPREEGYYWVKKVYRWRIGYWSIDNSSRGGYWILMNDPQSYRDCDFKEIDETGLVHTE